MIEDRLRCPPSQQSEFGIRVGYRHRLANRFFDDTPLKDEWQKEVYERSAAHAREHGFTSVIDVGCGSGFS